MEPKWIELPKLGDERGQLSVVEVGNHAPFVIRRVYWIFDTECGVVRGKHAHIELEQLAIVVSGSCKMRLNDGNSSIDVLMESPSRALYIGPGMWREMSEFSSDCVLLVLASEVYEESDYIRDYDQFKR